MSIEDITEIYIDAIKNNLPPKEFTQKIVPFYFGDESIVCRDPSDYKIPKEKESEFCEKISFWAWEDRCRGYGIITSETILNYIKQLKNP